MDFKKKFLKIVEKNDSLLCVGLDIDKNKIPDYIFRTSDNPFFVFNKAIIDATLDLVCAYKLNLAFYEALGLEGYKILDQTIKYIPGDIILILDGKKNDIGNTSEKYAYFHFESLNADATTINPYMGIDSVRPFLEYKGKCSFVLCRTSNPSSVDFQNLSIRKKKLFEYVALKIKKWNEIGCCGAVVGATYPLELMKIRSLLGEDIPILIPGIGLQGGDIKKTVKNGTNQVGNMAIINSSRGIIYSGDDEEFADKAREKACSLKNHINSYR
jgi:orotidine-5'-phosphate decarboxylase